MKQVLGSLHPYVRDLNEASGYGSAQPQVLQPFGNEPVDGRFSLLLYKSVFKTKIK